MYCSACATPVTAGLSYCNRCGMNLKTNGEGKQTASIVAFLTAITLIGIAGMGIMFGGTLTLTTQAHLKEELVGFFMLFTFLIIAITEVLLVRQLSRLTAAPQAKAIDTSQPLAMPSELRPAQPRVLS